MPKDLFITQNVIDPESGEILKKKEFTSASKFDLEKGYCFINPLQKGNKIVMSDLPSCITDAEAGKLLKLFRYAAPNSNLLMFRSGNVNKAMQKEHIAKILGLSARSCARFLNRMLKLNIIAKKEIFTVSKNKLSSRSNSEPVFQSKFVRLNQNAKEENYFFSPVYFFAGNWLSYDLYILFRNDLDKMLPIWVVSKFNAQK